MPKITVHGGPSNAATDEGMPEAVEPVVEDTAPAAPADSHRESYETFLVEDLRAELKDRNLPVTGNKAELVDRLVADDTKAED